MHLIHEIKRQMTSGSFHLPKNDIRVELGLQKHSMCILIFYFTSLDNNVLNTSPIKGKQKTRTIYTISGKTVL